MSFYQNYLRKCNEKGVSPSLAAQKAGTTKTSVNRWKNGSTPTDATIYKLADFFVCDISDLIDEKETPAAQGDGLNDKQRELIQLVEQLNDQQAAMLLSQVKGLLSDQ